MIEKIEDHPTADTLYIIQINLGDLGMKQVSVHVNMSHNNQTHSGLQDICCFFASINEINNFTILCAQLCVVVLFLSLRYVFLQVCAGLKGKYEVSELQGRSVVVLLNLKPAEFKVHIYRISSD